MYSMNADVLNEYRSLVRIKNRERERENEREREVIDRERVSQGGNRDLKKGDN